MLGWDPVPEGRKTIRSLEETGMPAIFYGTNVNDRGHAPPAGKSAPCLLQGAEEVERIRGPFLAPGGKCLA
jgi:hypothetical protein